MTRKGEKMYSLTYTLKNVPDLTLAKYQSLGENGIEGVLERHATFLRQWQGLSKTLNINITNRSDRNIIVTINCIIRQIT